MDLVCTTYIRFTWGRGRGMLKNAYFPQSHSRSGELETQGPRDLIVKIFQGETANVPF